MELLSPDQQNQDHAHLQEGPLIGRTNLKARDIVGMIAVGMASLVTINELRNGTVRNWVSQNLGTISNVRPAEAGQPHHFDTSVVGNLSQE